MQVLTAATQPSAAGPALRLLPAGVPVPLDGVPTAQLPLSGLGARYLVAVARRAAAAGWPVPELTALVAELAPRCRHLRISRRTHRGLQPFAEAAAAARRRLRRPRLRPSAAAAGSAGRPAGRRRRRPGVSPPGQARLDSGAAGGAAADRIAAAAAAGAVRIGAALRLVRPAGAGKSLPALHRGAIGMTRYRRRSIVLGLLAGGLLLALLASGGHDSGRPPAAMRRAGRAAPAAGGGERIDRRDLATTAAPVRWANVHQLVRSGRGDRPASGRGDAGRRPADRCHGGRGAHPRRRPRPGAAAGRRGRAAARAGGGARADVYQVRSGSGRARLAIAGVQVVAAASADGVATATVRVSPADVPRLIAAEAAGSPRLVAWIGRA